MYAKVRKKSHICKFFTNYFCFFAELRKNRARMNSIFRHSPVQRTEYLNADGLTPVMRLKNVPKCDWL